MSGELSDVRGVMSQFDFFGYARTWFVDKLGVVRRMSVSLGYPRENPTAESDRRRRVLRMTRAVRKGSCPSTLRLGGPHENEDGRCVACGMRE